MAGFFHSLCKRGKQLRDIAQLRVTISPEARNARSDESRGEAVETGGYHRVGKMRGLPSACQALHYAPPKMAM
jgi:hypothetical protein